MNAVLSGNAKTKGIRTVTIGKTAYTITSYKSENGRKEWELAYGKQIKNLFYSESLDSYTLWSARIGMGGHGLPKLVKPTFN
jgi:hypothetical protein